MGGIIILRIVFVLCDLKSAKFYLHFSTTVTPKRALDTFIAKVKGMALKDFLRGFAL